MSREKKHRNPVPETTETPQVPTGIQLLFWLTVFANSLFFIWQCLDRYLAPRFLFLSLALSVALLVLRKPLLRTGEWRLHTFDLVLLGWYGINLASAWQGLSWSEGIFFAQKTLLLFVAYWLFRQAFSWDMVASKQILGKITTTLTWVVSVIIIAQLGMAVSEKGLDNEALYAYASGVFGNKGLASDFLFFLVVLNVWLEKEMSRKWLLANVGILLALILVLQTRTVYLALFLGGLLYALGRYALEPEFRGVFLRKWVPVGVLTVLGLAVLALRGAGSLAERLNPLTYLESASANERRFVWYKTDLLNADHYWWGVGNGNWKIWLPSKTLEGAYRLQEKGVVFTRAHNDYLEIRAEMGMIGALYFIALFVLAAAALVWAVRQHRARAAEVLAIGAGLLGYCFIQYFDFPRERIEMQVVLALFFALAAQYGAGLWAHLPSVVLPQAVRQPFLLLLLVGSLFSAWVGYYRVVGEIHNVRMAQAYAKSDFAGVQREAKAARNTFLEYNDVVIPFEWYEGTSLFKANKPEEAVKAYEVALKRNPYSFQVLNNYATALATTKRYNEAIPIFEQAVQINPKYDEGKFNLAYSHTQLGNYPLALDWLTKVDTIPNPQTPDEVQKNKLTLGNLATFRKSIEEKQRVAGK
jgi:O-antigen ligase